MRINSRDENKAVSDIVGESLRRYVAVELCLERHHVDEKVLGLVGPGRIDAIAAGDKDLLVVKRFGTVRVVTPREFRGMGDGRSLASCG